MAKCVECRADMMAIGTEKFLCEDAKDRTNWQVMDGKMYLIFVVHYCLSCNILYLREPEKIFG